MQRSIIYLGALMLAATMVFVHVQAMTLQAKITSMQRSALQSGLRLSAANLAQQVSNAIAGGADPSDPLQTPAAIPNVAVCPNQAAVTGTICGDSLAATVSFSGTQTVSAGGAAQTIYNNDTGTLSNGQHVQGDVFYKITETLVNPAGIVIASNVATLHLTTTPRDVTNNANGPYANLVGLTDQEGSNILGNAEASLNGQCDPTAAGCTNNGGLDSVAQASGGSGADDTRIHFMGTCQNTSSGPGNTCDRTGATPMPQQDVSTFSNSNVSNANGGSGWTP